MQAKRAIPSWLPTLQQHVEKKPITLIRLNEVDSASLRDSKLGFNEFTLARPHEFFKAVRTPTVCIIFETPFGFGQPDYEDAQAFLGIISSCDRITTLDTRIKVKHATEIKPGNEKKLLSLLGESSHATQLKKKLELVDSVFTLSPKLSGEIIKLLADIQSNQTSMTTVANSLCTPRRYSDFAAIQEDAVQSALKAFGLGSSDRAEELELMQGKNSALARISTIQDVVTENQLPGSNAVLVTRKRFPLMEDSAIEKDARSVPGYKLISSDLTGRAVFKKGNEQLELFTANRRDLEHVFGVDLIYLNLSKKSIVMIQYKMLEPDRKTGLPTDWIYRPDKALKKEIARMENFMKQHSPGPLEYRLNPQVFYLKFIKRDAALTNGGIITTVDHYQKLIQDPLCKGPRNAVRISYLTLGGRYLRQGPFLDLIQSGYIGAHAETTEHFYSLVKEVLAGNRAIIAAIQSKQE